MDKFTSHVGVAAPLLRDNVDTDTIIPSREMKTVAKTGLTDGLFAAWRYLDEKARTPDPSFVLNKPAFENASILLSGNNFGCGSSREHAVWALKEFGIKCVIAEGFGSIFFRNCVRNGILPIVLEREKIATLAKLVEQDPQQHQPSIDLQNQVIKLAQDFQASFSTAESDREMLLNGWDAIAVTQKLQDKIDAFGERAKVARPWL